MEFLKIQTDLTAEVVKGREPNDDEKGEVCDGELEIFRHRGNTFQQLSVEAEDSEDSEEREFTWEWEDIE